MEEKKIKQKDMCRTVDCDKLAVTIFDAFKEAGVSLRMWLMKNSVKIVKLFLSPSSTPNQSLTETMKT